MIIKNSKKENGFTLIEALVAISILMIATVSPMSIAQKGLSSASYSKDQMTASFLAQDALEFIKNKRDEIGLRTIAPVTGQPLKWLEGLQLCFSPLNCEIDTTTEIDPIKTFSNSPLKITKNSGVFIKYDLSDSESSKFTRKVNIKVPAVTDDNEALVTITVTWPGGSVEIKNFIYNYFGNL